MSDESTQSEPQARPRAESQRPADEYVVYGVGGGRALRVGRSPALKAFRDGGTELMTSCGLIALAALESLDVVSRAAGRLMHAGALDLAHGGLEVAREVGDSAHGIVLDSVRSLVDTVVDVSLECVRGASTLAKEGEQLIDAGEAFAKRLVGAFFGIATTPGRRPEPAVQAVPIEVA